jgi:hypothetical protein
VAIEAFIDARGAWAAATTAKVLIKQKAKAIFLMLDITFGVLLLFCDEWLRHSKFSGFDLRLHDLTLFTNPGVVWILGGASC